VENRMRRLVRRSMVLQIARLRAGQVLERFKTRQPSPDRRLLSYATPLRPDIARGFDLARDAMARLAVDAVRRGARVALVQVPARFQLDPAEFERMRAEVTRFGFDLRIDGASERFAEVYAALRLPSVDLLEAFRATAQPTRMFFERTVHLTPEGHRVAADALMRFIDEQHLLP
jgi:lysophospholipase L1-like esterase